MIELEQRHCAYELCSGIFSVLPIDSQMYCSQHCQAEDSGNSSRKKVQKKRFNPTNKMTLEKNLKRSKKNEDQGFVQTEHNFTEKDAKFWAKEYILITDTLLSVTVEDKDRQTTTKWLTIEFLRRKEPMRTKVSIDGKYFRRGQCPIRIKTKEGSMTENVMQNFLETPKQQSLNVSVNEDITERIKKKSASEEKNLSNATKKKKMSEKKTTTDAIVKRSEKDNENGTQEIRSNNLKKSDNEGREMTLPEDSTPQYMSSEMVRSPSMNLIDDSAKHLYSLMKGLTHNYPPDKLEIQAYQPVTVQTAVDCAKEIRNLMFLKLETMKFQKELENEKK